MTITTLYLSIFIIISSVIYILFKKFGYKLFSNKKIDTNDINYFDIERIEREKNGFILNEYIVETLFSISVRLQIFQKDISENEKFLDEKSKELLVFLDKSIKNINNISRFIGSSKLSYDTLTENLMMVFDEYCIHRKVKINYKFKGKEKKLKKILNKFLVEIMQEILYVILFYNVLNNLDVKLRFGSNKLMIYVKYNSLNSNNKLINSENSLSNHVLKSIENRLSIINGIFKMKSNNRNKVTLFILLPLNINTLESEVVNND